MARERRVESAIEVVLLSTVPSPAPGPVQPARAADSGSFADPVAGRLIEGLREQGVEPAAVTTIAEPDPARLRTRLAAALAGTADGTEPPSSSLAPVLPAIAVLAADVVVNTPPLGALLDDPRVRTGALAVTTDGPAGEHVHLGLLKIDGTDRLTAAALVRAIPDHAERPDDAGRGDLLLELTRALTAEGVDVRPVPLGGYVWARPASAEQVATAVTAVDAVDERTVRLREAARGGDGFYSTFVLRRISWRFTGIAERIGLTPNQVTLISFGLGLVAAAFLALGSRPWSVAGALLLQFCLIVDCVDGELARYRRRFSRFGAWLDATTDRVKEFAAIGALAVAAARHEEDLWWLVAAAIALQTFRNLLDLGWALQRGVAEAARPVTSAPARPEWVAASSWLRPPSAERPGPGALSWVRRVGHFPIGERFLLISLGAALWSPRGTLVALLVAGLLSALYMLAAFAVRSRSAVGSGHRIAGLIDAGPLLGTALRQSIGVRAGRLTAVLPALVAVAELGLIWWLAVTVAGADPAAGTALVAAAAIAHYQHAYGVREDGTDTDTRAATGTEGTVGTEGTEGAERVNGGQTAGVSPQEAGGFVIGTDLRLVALSLIAVLPSMFLTGDDARSWATAAVAALAVMVLVSATVRSLQVWVVPSSTNHSDDPSGPDDVAGPNHPSGPGPGIVSGKQNEASVDRMQTVNADTGPTVLRPAIGGVR